MSDRLGPRDLRSRGQVAVIRLPRVALAVVIRVLRLSAVITQAELARRAGITAQHLASIEQGRRTRVGWHTVCRIAEALEVGVERVRWHELRYNRTGLLPSEED